jgi:signal transduction histidine kinase
MSDSRPDALASLASAGGSWAEALLDQLPVGLLVLGTDGRLLRLNQRAATWWGHPTNSSQGQPIEQLGAGQLPKAAYAALQRAATGQPTPGRYWLPAAGQWVTLTGTVQPTGEVVVYWHDATSQIAAEDYQALLTATDEGFCRLELLTDAQGLVIDYRFLEVNQVFEQQMDRAGVMGQRGSELVPEAAKHWLGAFTQVLQTGQPLRSEYYYPETGCWYATCVVPASEAGSHQVCLVFNDITARKQAQAAAHEHEARQAFLLQLSDALRLLADPLAVQQAATQTVLKFFGADRCYYCEIIQGEAIIRQDAVRGALPSMVGSYGLDSFPLLEAVFTHGQPLVLPNVHTSLLLNENLRQVCEQLQISAMLKVPVSKDGQPVGTLCVMQSTPRSWTMLEVELAQEVAERTWAAVERARAEEALRASEAQFRLFVLNSSDTLYKMSADWQQMLTLEGHNFLADTTEPTTTWLTHYIPPTDQPMVQAAIAAAIAAAHPFELEHRVYRADGAVGWALSRAVPVLDEDGQICEWFGAATDITARKQAEQALRESEAQLAAFNQHLEQQVTVRTRELQQSRDQLQSMFDTSLIALSVMEAVRDETGAVLDFRLLAVSQELERQAGRRDLVGKFYKQEFPGIVEVGVYDLLLRTLATGKPQSSEYYYNHEGIDRWFACQFVKLNDGIVATNLDITERKQAEQELRKNLHLLEQSEEVARLGSWVCELATGELRWSRGEYQLFSLKPGTPVQPQIYLDYVVPTDRPTAERVVQSLTTAPTNLEETLRLQIGNEVRTIRLKAMLLRDAAGLPTRILGVDLDISREQQLETDNLRLRLRQQHALFLAVQEAQEEERRRIAESLHNGLGQLLYATKIQLDRLHLQPEESVRREAARLLSEAISQTRALSHELTPALLEEFGLEAALHRICRTLSTPNLRWHCHITLDEGPELSPALQLAVYRLAQELTQNVVKHAHAREATLEVTVLPSWVVLHVEDDGQGFDPALTSDGLGLRTLRNRAAVLGASVHLTTAPGEGTQCQVRFPLTPIL